jgi:hypothetical protein
MSEFNAEKLMAEGPELLQIERRHFIGADEYICYLAERYDENPLIEEVDILAIAAGLNHGHELSPEAHIAANVSYAGMLLGTHLVMNFVPSAVQKEMSEIDIFNPPEATNRQMFLTAVAGDILRRGSSGWEKYAKAFGPLMEEWSADICKTPGLKLYLRTGFGFIMHLMDAAEALHEAKNTDWSEELKTLTGGEDQ